MVCPWYLELLVYACYDLGVYEPWLLCAHPRTNRVKADANWFKERGRNTRAEVDVSHGSL